jgi:hypothetical protein
MLACSGLIRPESIVKGRPRLLSQGMQFLTTWELSLHSVNMFNPIDFIF